MLGSFFNRIKKLPKKYLIIGMMLIASSILFLPRSQAAAEFEFTEVRNQDIAETVSASGILTGKNTVNLNFLQGGKLAFINVKTGDKVYQGQTIAGLDTQALGIELQQAQNTLRDRQAATDKVLDDIYLFQYGNGGFSNVGSPNETMIQRQLRTAAEVARDNAVDSVKGIQRDFEDKFITAPFSGIVTQSNAFPGQFIGASTVIAQIVDNSGIFFEADIDEADIGKVAVGQKATVILDAFGDQVFKGTIDEILPLTKTTSTQATVVTARILIDSIPKFIVGLQGQASIETESADKTLTIPIEALRPDSTVVVQTPDGLQSVKVTTGIQSDTDIQISSGLQEGQRVLLNPPSALPQRQQSFLQQITRPLRGTFRGR